MWSPLTLATPVAALLEGRAASAHSGRARVEEEEEVAEAV